MFVNKCRHVGIVIVPNISEMMIVALLLPTLYGQQPGRIGIWYYEPVNTLAPSFPVSACGGVTEPVIGPRTSSSGALYYTAVVYTETWHRRRPRKTIPGTNERNSGSSRSSDSDPALSLTLSTREYQSFDTSRPADTRLGENLPTLPLDQPSSTGPTRHSLRDQRDAPRHKLSKTGHHSAHTRVSGGEPGRS